MQNTTQTANTPTKSLLKTTPNAAKKTVNKACANYKQAQQTTAKQV